jgi:sec-independent protein translocase protein TatA
MGLGGLSLGHLLVILLIVVLIFGTKKLRTIGGDLGGAIKAFRKSVEDPNQDEEPPKLQVRSPDASPIEHNEKADSSTR